MLPKHALVPAELHSVVLSYLYNIDKIFYLCEKKNVLRKTETEKWSTTIDLSGLEPENYFMKRNCLTIKL